MERYDVFFVQLVKERGEKDVFTFLWLGSLFPAEILAQGNFRLLRPQRALFDFINELSVAMMPSNVSEIFNNVLRWRLRLLPPTSFLYPPLCLSFLPGVVLNKQSLCSERLPSGFFVRQ